MDHGIYGDWNGLHDIRISNDGRWAAYEVRPGQGDGVLHLVNLQSLGEKTFERGSNPRFSPESDYLAFRIKPPFTLVRKKKMEKKGKEAMPKDSLGIYRLGQDLLSKVPRVEEFRVPDKASSWLVLRHYHKTDTASADTNEYGVKLAMPEGKPSKMVVMDPVRNDKHEFEKVYDFEISEEGKAVVFSRFFPARDTVPGRAVEYLDLRKGLTQEIFASEGSYGRMGIDPEGEQVAFLHHPDSGIMVGLDLYYWSPAGKTARKIVDTLSTGMPEGWGISKHAGPWFSGDGSRLYFGTAPLCPPEAKDTLPEEEKYRVDIWNWQDGLLQSMQLKQLERERKRTHLAVWHVGTEVMVQLGGPELESVITMHRGNGDLALGASSIPYHKLISWETYRYQDFYLIDTRSGSREVILKKKPFGAELSPGGRYLAWYEPEDSNYYAHGVESGGLVCLTCGIEDAFYDGERDIPAVPRPYGIAGFTEGDKGVLLNARYDIWKTDPAGKKLPVNLTLNSGTQTGTEYRYRHLEYDDPFIPLKKSIFLEGFNDRSKETGIYEASALISMKPRALVQGRYRYELLARARDADILLWRKGDFDEYPDVYVSDPEFRERSRISDANPQATDFYWGNPRLVRWKSYSGEDLEGILYVPEDFDPTREYPMLVYFYEKRSDRLYRHVSPTPSRSTINFAWCVSNGYVVFVPDVTYREGHPGQSAYDAVVSGTLAMCEQLPFIDRDNIGIQGHSWGGYQVAWILTRTDLYRAAMAGAPVANMTSAYGGIRWQSGASRMMQYEKGQSRIGGTLWERPDLYLENSPIFRVPDIQTPLLIMHNDADGAVPWSQGIELFVAMRRLQKPAWMLVYNDEAHNLRNWPNRVDLSIRMMQFFDHYLKGEPAPAWMSEGIPALEKGKVDGYEPVINTGGD